MCNLVEEASIPSALKQQKTLKSFLQSKLDNNLDSPSKSKKVFTCPICSKNFEMSVNLFDIHVNSCIANENYTSGDENGMQECLSYSKETINISEEAIVSNPESTPTGMALKYFCPVCELNPNVNNLVELNSHIDNCLNKKEIRKILASESQGNNKR